jgi:hypothetical protein
MAGLSAVLLPVIWFISDIVSVPPAIITSASPRRMRSAAMATVCKPEAQNRFTVTPGTLFGMPASSRPIRATFIPCSASGIAQPTMTSSTSAGSSPGACAITDPMACASMSSGRT